MKIAIDGMGLDLGLEEVVKACNKYVENNHDDKLFLVAIESELQKYELNPKIEVVHATSVMTMEEGALAVRRKKDSTMVKAVDLVATGVADAVVSFGSTGAFLTAAALGLRFIDNVQRAALVGAMPNAKGGFTTILDLGANAENSAAHLLQFAIMGNLYAKNILGITSPRIALLNIGSEAKKGDPLRKDAYKLIEGSGLNFIGNLEGREILNNVADVVVTDGFTGNVTLKLLEGATTTMLSLVKEAMTATTLSSVGAMLVKKNLSKMKQAMDVNEIGGALLLGVNGVVIKGHGNSDVKAIMAALNQAKKMVNADIVNKIRNDLEVEYDKN